MPKWTEEEKETLNSAIKSQPDLTADDLRHEFPDRSLESLGRAIRRARTSDSKREKEDTDAQVLKLAQKGASLRSICDAVDRSPATVEASIEKLQQSGYRLHVAFDSVSVVPSEPAGMVTIPLDHFREGAWFEFGALSDTHISNRHHRNDVLHAAYDLFESEGIKQVFHGGNWIDGEARFNKTELLTPPGFEHQVEYFLDHYPHRPGITTSFVDGDDHEGWYAQREGIAVGKRLEQTARERGRNDLQYLGYAEADIPLYRSEGDRPAILRLMHGGGGASYALSYVVQKTIETFQGGEKPQVLFIGHHHKAEYLYYRDVHTCQLACTMDQTLFMRKRKIAAHVGFWIIRLQVASDGSVRRFIPEFFPFFDRGYVNNLYAIGGVQKEIVGG